jgi:hypothetical protein
MLTYADAASRGEWGGGCHSDEWGGGCHFGGVGGGVSSSGAEGGGEREREREGRGESGESGERGESERVREREERAARGERARERERERERASEREKEVDEAYLSLSRAKTRDIAPMFPSGVGGGGGRGSWCASEGMLASQQPVFTAGTAIFVSSFRMLTYADVC